MSTMYSRSILSSSYTGDSASVLAVSEENVRRSIIGGSDEAEDIQLEPIQRANKDESTELEPIQRANKDINTELEPIQRGNKDESTMSDRRDRVEFVCGQCFRFLAMFRPFQRRVIKDESNTVNNIQEPKYVKLRSQTIRRVTEEQVTTIDISKANDKNKAEIGELTVVQTHYCVVTDKVNKSVKVADTRDRTVKSEILLSKADGIFSISSINDDQVAVAALFTGVQRILFFSVSATGDITDTHRSMDVISPLYNGIIYSKHFFYTAALNQINIISMDGRTIKSIKDNSFGAIWGIALSNDHETIYICSYSKSTVFSLDLKGSVKAYFMDGDLNQPRGVTVDREGFVYVCCAGSRNVHRFSADLSTGHVIISGISVTACAFNQTENKLCLASNCDIKVYNMNNIE